MKSLEQLQALIGVLVLLVVVFVYARRAWGRTRNERLTTNSHVLDVMDEVFSPARHARRDGTAVTTGTGSDHSGPSRLAAPEPRRVARSRR